MEKLDKIFSAAIADRIRQLRKQNGFTQRELAERSGVSRRTIQAIEAAEIHPRLNILNAIAEALGQIIDIREKDERSKTAEKA